MKQFVSKIWHSSSARDVGKLLSANVVAQAIGLLIYPILTRLYSPEDFGLLNLFLSIGGVFVILSTMEYFNAIVLPKTDEEARGLVHVSLMLIAGVTALLVFTIPFANPISALFNTPNLAVYWWLLPIWVCLAGIWNVLNYWYIRKKEYGRISGYQISQSLFSSGYKIVFGLLNRLQGGLLYATILAPFCSIAVSVLLCAKRHIVYLLKFEKDACKKAALNYSNFPKYSAPRSLLNYLSGNLPTLMLTPIFGLEELGYVGMAFTLALRPIQLVVQSVYQVLYQRIADLVNKRLPFSHFLRRYIGGSLIVTTPLMIGLYLILPDLTGWLLGDSWSQTGEYIRLLLPWIALVVVNTAVNFIPDIFGKQFALLCVESCYLVLRVLSLIIGIYAKSISLAIILFSFSGVTVLLGELVWFMLLARKHDKIIENENTNKIK